MLLGVLVLLAAATLGLLTYRYSHDMYIDRTKGISEGGYVEIGGVP